MIYNDLGDISLSRFIDIFLGDIDKVVKDGNYAQEEKEEAATRLCNEYMVIVGGKAALSIITKRGELLKLQMRETCMNAAKRLIMLSDTDGAVSILANLGYKVNKSKPEQVIGKIKSVLASDKYRMARISDSLKGDDSRTVMDRDYFVKERVSVMSHNKMYIDEHTFTAKEYAYMVKRMCDEIEELMRSTKKK